MFRKVNSFHGDEIWLAIKVRENIYMLEILNLQYLQGIAHIIFTGQLLVDTDEEGASWDAQPVCYISKRSWRIEMHQTMLVEFFVLSEKNEKTDSTVWLTRNRTY